MIRPRAIAVVLASVVALGLAARESLLRELRDSLRGTGVGVRTEWSSKARATAPKTPTLAPLIGFPLTTMQSSPPRRSSELFRARTFEDAALIAVTGKRRARLSVALDIPRLWRRAPPARRVFVAFARHDLNAANAVRRALERQGYHCFLYIPGKQTAPWADPVELGRYFREAGVRLVIDSRAARANKGVRLEAHALPPARPGVARPGVAEETSKREPCCKVCYYLNGMLAGCDPITCGAHCANARGL